MALATKVRLLDSGSCVIDQSHITWNVGCGTPVRFPVYSVLIEHPDGLMLFDTGFDKGLVEEKLAFELPEQTPQQTIPGQLELAGFKPDDVDAVINSHLHFDHCGGNRHLRRATVHLHADEIREARSPEPFEVFGYADRSWDHPEATFSLLTGDVELAPGVHLFHTPGHTIGHYSLLVEMEGRAPLLFMSDVSYTPAAYAKDQQSGFHWNPVAGVRSIRRVKQIARETGAEIFFTHDMETFATYKLAPEFYAA
jgi:4-pyridoxolactonase